MNTHMNHQQAREVITISSSSSDDSSSPDAAVQTAHHHQPSPTTAVTSPPPPQAPDRASITTANRGWCLGFAGRLLQAGPLPRHAFMVAPTTGASGSRSPPASLWVPRSELTYEDAPRLDDVVNNKGIVGRTRRRSPAKSLSSSMPRIKVRTRKESPKSTPQHSGENGNHHTSID